MSRVPWQIVLSLVKPGTMRTMSSWCWWLTSSSGVGVVGAIWCAYHAIGSCSDVLGLFALAQAPGPLLSSYRIVSWVLSWCCLRGEKGQYAIASQSIVSIARACILIRCTLRVRKTLSLMRKHFNRPPRVAASGPTSAVDIQVWSSTPSSHCL